MLRLWQFAVLTFAVILVPFLIWEDAILGLVRRLIEPAGARPALAAAVAGLLALDVLLPLPSSLLSTAAGALFGFLPGMLVSASGMTAGCLLGYTLGSRAPAGRWIAAGDLDRLRTAQKRYGDWLLIVFRAVPVLAEASVFFAGLSRFRFRRFLLLTSLSNAGISTAYAAAGAFSARRETFLFAFLAAILLPAVALLAAGRRRQP